MRILIMCDMEGVSGIVTWEQVGGGKSMYEEGRQLYTAEVNAAVRGAARAGAKEIIVIDGHNAGGDWRYNSLVKDMLHPACEYVAHHTWTHYRQPLEQGADACLLVGISRAQQYARWRLEPYHLIAAMPQPLVQ